MQIHFLLIQVFSLDPILHNTPSPTHPIRCIPIEALPRRAQRETASPWSGGKCTDIPVTIMRSVKTCTFDLQDVAATHGFPCVSQYAYGKIRETSSKRLAGPCDLLVVGEPVRTLQITYFQGARVLREHPQLNWTCSSEPLAVSVFAPGELHFCCACIRRVRTV